MRVLKKVHSQCPNLAITALFIRSSAAIFTNFSHKKTSEMLVCALVKRGINPGDRFCYHSDQYTPVILGCQSIETDSWPRSQPGFKGRGLGLLHRQFDYKYIQEHLLLWRLGRSYKLILFTASLPSLFYDAWFCWCGWKYAFKGWGIKKGGCYIRRLRNLTAIPYLGLLDLLVEKGFTGCTRWEFRFITRIAEISISLLKRSFYSGLNNFL